jgi:hypothetical protein
MDSLISWVLWIKRFCLVTASGTLWSKNRYSPTGYRPLDGAPSF